MRKYTFFIIIACLALVSFFIGCGGDSSSKGVASRNIDSFTITGVVSKGFNWSLRTQVTANPLERAKVWIEQKPHLYTFTDADGNFSIGNVPEGVYNVVARFQEGSTVYKMRSQSVTSKPNKTETINITVYEAKNIVTGTIRTESGSFLLPGTKLYLWGEEFEVEQEGRFTTPQLPDLGLDGVTNDIVVNMGKPTEIRLAAAFVSDFLPIRLDLVAPISTSSVNKIPSVSLMAIAQGKVASVVDAQVPINIRAVIFPENISPQNVEWTASNGELSLSSSTANNVHTRTFTPPAKGGSVTITVNVSNEGYTVKALLTLNVNAPPTYIITYDGNGNTSGIPPKDIKSYFAGESLEVLANSSNLAKTGFVFAGWSPQPYSSTTYSPGDLISMPADGITLYAKWVIQPTYRVLYNGNQSTSGRAPSDSTLYHEGQVASVFANTGDLKKDGHLFVGWNTDPNGTGTTYQSGNTLRIENENINLYAIWVPYFVLTYHGNGHTSGTPPADITKYQQNDIVAVRGNTGNLVRAGHTFAGWSANESGTGKIYEPGSTFGMPAENLILYARWTTNPTYRIIYNGNGNNSGDVPTDQNRYETGEIANVLNNIGNLTKTAHKFIGWNTKENGSGTTYTPDSKISVQSSDLYLYARWIPVYSITYYANGHTSGTVPTDLELYEEGMTATVMENTGNLKKDSHTFKGWNTRADGKGDNFLPGSPIRVSNYNISLFAKWELNPTYWVKYDKNEANRGDIPVGQNFYEEGTTISVLGNLGNLEKDGFKFVFWNTQQDGTGTDYSQGDQIKIGKSNITLYAKWRKTYRVIYNKNNSTSGNPPEDNTNYEQGVSVPILYNTGAMIKTGFYFDGWNSQPDGRGEDYLPGATFKIGSKDVVLYAKWTPNPRYWVYYEANGATSGNRPSDMSYEADETVTISPNSGNLQKAGFYFDGWCTTQDGTNGTEYKPYDSLKMPSNNIVLYVKWAPNPTYAVIYKPNGATSGSEPISEDRYEAGETVVVLGNTGNLKKTGYYFENWNTKADESGESYYPGGAIIMGNENITLYAVWKPNPRYSITYHPNNATEGEVPIDRNTYEQGEDVEIKANLGYLSIARHTFAGWNTDKNGGGTFYQPSDILKMPPANLILYAIFTLNPVYKVTYNANGADSGRVPQDETEYEKDQYVEVLANTLNLAKYGHTFGGWNTKADGNGIDRAPGSMFKMGSADITLYALWIPRPTFKVIYDSNDADAGSVPIDPQAYLEGEIATIYGNPGSLALSGFSFAGWNTRADGQGVTYSRGDEITIQTVDIRLYALWTPNPRYAVIYSANGADSGNVPVDNNRYQTGDQIVAMASDGSLKKEGFTFSFWNTKADGTGDTYAYGQTFYMGSSDVTLYAKWLPNPTFTVTYKPNDATSGNLPVDNNRYEEGEPIFILGNLYNLARIGFGFDMWNSKSNGSGMDYQFGQTYYMGTENLELYPKWYAVFSITYDGNGAESGYPPVDTNNYKEGTYATVLGNSGNLQLTGKTFSGWNSKPDGSGIDYSPGYQIGVTNQSIILYAKWLP